MYHAKKKGRQMYEFFRPEMLFDPIEPRSNAAAALAGAGFQRFSFGSISFPFLRKRGTL